ncbi:MAG: outer membrane protein assembly factor BamA [Thiomargarita sp.]|nr:outer membrane protein assembly factor BamA [Thiomargarita sp.]
MILNDYSLIKPAILLIILLEIMQTVAAFDSFVVEDIQVKGLRRLEVGTVYNYLQPVVMPGQDFSQNDTKAAIAVLFKTGFFRDVRLDRKDNILIVSVEERSIISKLTFSGNEEIVTEDLTRALKNINFADGEFFNRSRLERVTLEVQRQYFNLGRYAVQIKSTVSPLSRNRVKIHIDIAEGEMARIKQINFVGNHSISDDALLETMTSSTAGWFSYFTENDQYSEIQLSADLEALRSYYLDRGYIQVNIDSTQVSISADKQDVYITINVTEGDQYTISALNIAGKLIVSKAELLKKISIQVGDIYSRKQMSKSREAMLERIGDEGYSFANINTVPEINTEEKTVSINFFVDPGKRVYVRRITFQGNRKTRDDVLRREMRQMEGGWISTKKMKRSLTRLERLNFFDTVSVETPRVPNTDDQVDVHYTVVERASGNLMAGVGYGHTQGIVFNTSVTQDNFLGTGKRVGLTFNKSDINTVYSFSHFNPYITKDGISQNFSIFYRTTDAEEANLSRYTTDAYGNTLKYGVPVTEFDYFSMGVAIDHTVLKATEYSAQEIFDFIEENGDTYNSYRLNSSIRHDTRNRSWFPNSGNLQSLGIEVALPFSELNYYKVHYRYQWLYPLFKDYIFLVKGQYAQGEGYGDTKELPFFENYTAGGPRTIRGFRENTLGPQDSNLRALGGNVKVVNNIEFIVPIPFVENTRTFRLSVFIDAGNVYGPDEQIDISQFRYSTGVSLIWLSPLGVLSFSYAKPFREFEGDETRRFQFTLGTTFNW